MRALITGACGFVGKYLIDHLLSFNDQVLATTLLPLDLKVKSVVMDITNQADCTREISNFAPDVIYHLAGISFVPQAEADFQKALMVNVAGVSNVYRSAHLLDRGIKVILVSSAEVYGRIDQSDLPISEKCQLRPANNYSLSKAMAEMVAQRYNDFGTVKSVIIRPFNHIGAGQNNQFVASNFAFQLAQIAKQKAPAQISVGNLEAKRDFSDVRDIVRAYRLAAEKGQGIYNLCAGRSYPISEILSTLIEISGQKVEIIQDPSRMRAAEVKEIYGSYKKAELELGWKPSYTLRQSLDQIYQYWLEKT